MGLYNFRFRLHLFFYCIIIPISLSYGFHSQQIPLQIEGKIRFVYFFDVNDDDKPDLVVMHSAKKNGKYHRFLSVFFNRDVSSPCIPDYTYHLSEKISFFDFAQLDRDRKGFLFLQTEGLYFHEWHEDLPGSNFCQLVSVNQFFPLVDVEKTAHYQMVYDTDGDDTGEIFLPGINTIYIFKLDSLGDFQPVKNTPLTITPNLNITDHHRFHFSIPQIFIKNMHPDNGDELCVWTSQFLHVFSTENYQEIQTLNMAFDILAGSYAQNKEKQTIMPLLIDINHDGLTDFLLSVKSPNYFPYSMNQLQVYFNKNGTFAEQPNQILSANNINGEYVFHDFNFDHTLDAGLLQMSIELKEIISFLFLGKLKAKLNIFCAHPDIGFPDKPSNAFSFEWHPSLMTAIGKKAFLLNLNGDYNGDGLKDFMVGVFPKSIQIYLGNKKGVFEREISYKIHLPLSHNFQQIDWNCNGKTDLIFWDIKTSANQLTWIQF